MSSLGRRLWVAIVAAMMVLVTAVFVGFVLWAQSKSSVELSLRLRVVTLDAALKLASRGSGPPTDSIEKSLQESARREGIVLRVVGPGQGVVPVGWSVSDGLEFWRVDLGDGSGQGVVGARSLEASWQGWDRSHLLALSLLVVAASVVSFLLMGLLRRSVLGPVSRIGQLVGNADYDGLKRFGDVETGGMAHLGRAISGMHARIGSQLEEITRAHDELRRTQDELVRATRLAVVGELAAGLAHEIGNPLTVLRGFVDVLAADIEDPASPDARALDRMGVEIDRIQRTVRALLDFSRAGDIVAGHTDVREAVAHVQELVNSQERFRKVTIETDVSENLRISMSGDALIQVLLNLFLNSADAMEDGGRIGVRAWADDGSCCISVGDDGPGIPDDVIDTVFDPFVTTKPAGQGTGLGLSVCERLVRAAGGTIRVRAEPGQGAEFTLRVPVA